METTCKNCQKPINVKPSQLKEGNNFCSKNCFYKSKVLRPYRKNGADKTCKICEKQFYVSKVRIESQYCSMRCKGIGSRHNQKPCEVCGNLFQPVPGRKDAPCCSRECAAARRKTGVEKSCVICKKLFYVAKSQSSLVFHCRSESCTRAWRGRNKTTHICKICNKEFRWSPSRTKSSKYNIIYCSWDCRDKDPEKHEKLIAMNVAQQKGKQTKPETIGYAILDSFGIDYLPQHLVANKFCVDAFIPTKNLIVQFDGDYWHGNPAKFTELDARQTKRARLDKSQDAYMAVCGYQVIRIWESDLIKDVEHVKSLLLSAIRP